jgi:hypothetical protein
MVVRLRGLLYEACKMNRWSTHSIGESEGECGRGGAKAEGWNESGHPEGVPGAGGVLVWGDSFWADGYFAETVGNVDEEVVKRYIADQRQ